MKQFHDSSDDSKFPVAANETLSEKTAVFMELLLMPVIGPKSLKTFFLNFVVLCDDNDIIIFSVYSC